MERVPVFDCLAPLFEERGFALYMVGGLSRDYLLGRKLDDYDFATDATPEEMSLFLPNLDATFARYGAVRTRVLSSRCDITTLREEGEYKDHRHPSLIRYVKEPSLDSVRRDFTVNALYIDSQYRVLDFHNGKRDLEAKLLRFIGNPYRRIQEDPLRIIRAERFEKILGFQIEEESQKAIDDLRSLLSNVSKGKKEEEIAKGWKGQK